MRVSFHHKPSKRKYDRHAKNARRTAWTVFFLVFFLFSASILVLRAMDTGRTREINEANKHLIAESTASATEAPVILSSAATAAPSAPEATAVPEILSALRKMQQQNSDLVGWLDVECVDEINFAVVQRDNIFYLTHDFYQKKNSNGTAFLDEACTISPQDDQLIIYAHNMFDGTMFGKLNRLTSLSRIKEAPFTRFATLDEEKTYVPVAVLHCSVDPDAEDYFAFAANRLTTKEAFDRHIARAKELSVVSLPFDAQFGDQLLTLSTCIKNESDKRLVVVLRAMRAGETREDLAALLN